MSKALLTRLSALEARLEGRGLPRPSIVGIRDIDGVIRAEMPHPMEPEIFADAAELEARANELGLQAILVRIVDARRHPTQEAPQCTA